jgi:hypothetical protein
MEKQSNTWIAGGIIFMGTPSSVRERRGKHCKRWSAPATLCNPTRIFGGD